MLRPLPTAVARPRTWVLTWVALAVCVPPEVALGVPTPEGNCPQPANTLLVNEFQVGAGLKGRWVEVFNPGASTVSLENVVVRVTAKDVAVASGGTGDVIEFSIDAKIQSLPSLTAMVVGHIPGYDPDKGGAYPGFQLFDLGAGFVLPLCDVKLQVIGPKGIIDAVNWDLCAGNPDPPEALWQTIHSLDPDHADICLNDSPGVWCKASKDGLTKSTPSLANAGCDLDGDGFTKDMGDCDDDAKAIAPTAFEYCNGVDDNCNGQTDEDVKAPSGTCLSLGVCKGPLASGSPVAQCKGSLGWNCNYPTDKNNKYESVNETICDHKDNDCDGETDEGLLNACGKCPHEGSLVEICDGIDNDCDGLTDEDVDLSGIKCADKGVCVASVAVCDPVAGVLCATPLSWQATETRCDGLDNDCDGLTDEDMGLGQPCSEGKGQCMSAGTWQCAPGGKLVCDAIVGQAGSELCGDGLDNDCDGATDEGFNIGEQCAVGVGICRVQGRRVCNSAGTGSVCSARLGEPAEAEVCGNHLDDDCDGATDEAGCVRAGDGGGLGACGASDAPGPGPAGGVALLVGIALWLVGRRRSRAAIGPPTSA